MGRHLNENVISFTKGLHETDNCITSPYSDKCNISSFKSDIKSFICCEGI